MDEACVESCDEMHETVGRLCTLFAEMMVRRLKAMHLEKYSREFEVTLHPEAIETNQWKITSRETNSGDAVTQQCR